MHPENLFQENDSEKISEMINQIIKENHAKNISILIGPEGDFSKLELEKIFEHNNIVEATLGKNILKGETAAIVASALVKENIKVC